MAKMATLTDDFNDNSINAVKWLATGEVSESSNVLRFEASLASGEASLISQATYDMSSSYAFIKIVDPGTQNSENAFVALKITDGEHYYLGWIITNGTIIVDGSTGTIYSETYNADTYRYLRIRESGGTIYYDYSANGFSWTNAVSESYNVGSSGTYFVSGLHSEAATSNTTSIDNVNLTSLTSAPLPLFYRQ